MRKEGRGVTARGDDLRDAARCFGLLGGPAPQPLPGTAHLFAVGDRVLKRHWFLTADRAAVLEGVLADLAREGLHPALYPGEGGALLQRVSGGWFSLMERLEPGPAPGSEDLDEAARLVARTHAVLARHGGGAALRSPMWAEPGAVAGELEAAGRAELARHVLDGAALRGLAVRLVHNDLHPGNFLRARGRLWLLDFDSFSHNPVVGDVFFCGLRLAGAEGVERFAAAYRRDGALADGDLAAGWTALLADLSRKVAFILRRRAAGDETFVKDMDKYLGFIEAARAEAGRAG